MNRQNTKSVLEKVYDSKMPDLADIEYLLARQNPEEMEILFDFADEVRHKFVGDGILLRGIVEFSNYCRNTCSYCGLNKYNKTLPRYRLSQDEIIAAIKYIVSTGVKTVVLQSGEDDKLEPYWLRDIIEQIKTNFDIAVTLSVGEWNCTDYLLWKQAGADRYLLKIETTDQALYQNLHPQMSFKNRLECSKNLKMLGYQNGSGCIVGLKGQTIRTLAKDILFFKKENFDMIGIGLFIPHAHTVLGPETPGDLNLTLKTLAVTRIITKDTHLPATTSIGSAGGCDQRVKALKAGANVIMPNFTPHPYRSLYEIYPDKRCVNEHFNQYISSLEKTAQTLNRTLDYAKGDSLKRKYHSDAIHN